MEGVQKNLNGVDAWEKGGDPSIKETTVKSNYRRFFINAFKEGEIEQILKDGGGEVFSNFKSSADAIMQKRDYAERMFNPVFEGKDHVVRPSQYHRLSEKIWEKYFKTTETRTIEVKMPIKSIEGIPNFRYQKQIRVTKGHYINFRGKDYKPGQRLPNNYYEMKGSTRGEGVKG